jgi:hypothetical protein
MRRLLFVALALAAVPASAQPSPPGGNNAAWTPLRTPDGHPDLQGVWLNNSATPLERPKAFEGKPRLSDEEVAELRKRAARIFDASVNSDFAGGDGFYLALLVNPDRYRNPAATGGSTEMIEREIDERTSLIQDPPDGRIPPLTPEGQQRIASRPAPVGGGLRVPAGPEEFSPALRCLTYGVPRFGAGNVANAGSLGYYEIVQTKDYVVLMLEAIHEARIIPLAGQPHLPESLRLWGGDPRGRWEGDTLVVETTNFAPYVNFLGSAEHLNLVERFTRTAADTLTYEITLNDPTTWTTPWIVVIRLKQSSDRLFEYACHEGNYDVMRSMLLGARAQEK